MSQVISFSGSVTVTSVPFSKEKYFHVPEALASTVASFELSVTFGVTSLLSSLLQEANVKAPNTKLKNTFFITKLI